MSNAMEATGLEGSAVMVKLDPVTFAKRFLEARRAAGLTQRQLADACGISDRTVSAWEKGTAEGILAENLFCVADKMGVDARWLATGIGSARSQRADLGRLSQDERAAVLALIETLSR